MTSVLDSVTVETLPVTEHRSSQEYRLVVFERDEDDGARSVYDVVEGDLRTVMTRALEFLNPGDPLVIRKKEKTRAQRREERRRYDAALVREMKRRTYGGPYGE